MQIKSTIRYFYLAYAGCGFWVGVPVKKFLIFLKPLCIPFLILVNGFVLVARICFPAITIAVSLFSPAFCLNACTLAGSAMKFLWYILYNFEANCVSSVIASGLPGTYSYSYSLSSPNRISFVSSCVQYLLRFCNKETSFVD